VRLQGAARRITIFIGESDRYHHKPLYAEIVHRAHQRGLAGASVFRGIEGFGAASRIHTSRLLSLSEDLPLAIIIVDSAERTDAFLDEIADLVTGGLVMVDDVYVHTYIGGGADATDGGAAGGGAAGGAAGGPTGGPAGSGTG
jgi:PII-like signaling protein